MKYKTELKGLEIKVSDQENENVIIKKFENSMTSDFYSEKQRFVQEIKSLKEEIKRLNGEITKKDNEVHSIKIEVEKCKIENLDHSKEKRRLENELLKMEDKIRQRSPVMMKNETIFKKESDETKNKKACLFELDQMVRQYRSDFSKQKVD